jgi:hypothetical protein
MPGKHIPFATFRPYFHGLGVFLQRLPALVSCGILLAIAWFDLGGDYNVPSILWQHSDDYTLHACFLQFLNGLSISLLFGYVWLVAFVVEVHMRGKREIEAILPQPPNWLARVVDWLIPHRRESDDFSQQMRLYFALTWLPMLAAIAVPTCISLSTGEPFVLGQRWPFLIGVLTTFFIVLGAFRVSNDHWTKDRARSTRDLAFVLFVACAVGYLVLCYLNHTKRKLPDWLQTNYLPPFVSLCVLLGVLNGVAGSLWYFLRSRAIWGFTALTAIFICCNCYPYKLRFEALDYDNRLNLSDAEEPEAPPPGKPELAFTEPKGEALSSERRFLAAGCARLHAQLFRTNADIDFEKQTCEELFHRYRKLQLEVVDIALFKQLYPSQPESNPDDLDHLSYDKLFANYQKLRSDASSIEVIRFLRPWRENLASSDSATLPSYKPRLAVLAVTGGANRSAFWVNVVLDRIERELKGPGVHEGESRFPRHIRLVAGASGGMVGAAQYVCTLDDRGRHVRWDEIDGSWTIRKDKEGKPIPANLLDPFISADQVDYLTPVMNRIVFCDVPAAFVPTPYYMRDRGHCLEDCFNGTCHEMEQSFANLRDGEEAGWRPSIVFSPMQIEDGRRLLISNLPLAYLASSSGALLLGKDSYSSQRHGVRRSQFSKSPGPANDTNPPWMDLYARSAVELFRLFPEKVDQFKISTAARMNATFPYISPAVELPTDPPRRVVDAGYFDNYGINIAAGWITNHQKWLHDNTSGVVLIQLRDGRSYTSRRQLVNPDESPSQVSTGLAKSLQWLDSPLSGAEAAYVAVSSFRNDEQLQSLDRWFNRDSQRQSDRPFFTTVVFERPGQVGMNWNLDQDKVKTIRNGMDDESCKDNQEALGALKQWWGKGY